MRRSKVKMFAGIRVKQSESYLVPTRMSPFMLMDLVDQEDPPPLPAQQEKARVGRRK